jgi:hypothetical protein
MEKKLYKLNKNRKDLEKWERTYGTWDLPNTCIKLSLVRNNSRYTEASVKPGFPQRIKELSNRFNSMILILPSTKQALPLHLISMDGDSTWERTKTSSLREDRWVLTLPKEARRETPLFVAAQSIQKDENAQKVSKHFIRLSPPLLSLSRCLKATFCDTVTVSQRILLVGTVTAVRWGKRSYTQALSSIHWNHKFVFYCRKVNLQPLTLI